MSERITVKDVRSALEGLRRAASSVGLDGTTAWTVQMGSQTYGRAYRLFAMGERGSLGRTPLPEYLGMTAREAVDSLRLMTSTLHAVHSSEWLCPPVSL